MNQTEMSVTVRQLPTAYLENYAESFEAGIVASYVDPSYCVVACLCSPASLTAFAARDDNYDNGGGDCGRNPAPEGSPLNRIEKGYETCGDSKAAEASYRTRLYDAVVEELAARAMPVEVAHAAS